MIQRNELPKLSASKIIGYNPKNTNRINNTLKLLERLIDIFLLLDKNPIKAKVSKIGAFISYSTKGESVIKIINDKHILLAIKLKGIILSSDRHS
jgi:hypothetical protein